MNETHRRLHGTDYDSLRSLADQNHEGAPQHDPLEDLARLVSEDPQNAYGQQGYVQEDFFAQEEMQLRGPIDGHLDAPQDHAAYYEQAYVNGAYPEAAYAPYDESYDTQPQARRIPSALMLLLGVLVLGGVGYGSYRLVGGGSAPVTASGEAPLIKANEEPAKTVPQQADNSDAARQNKLIYDRVGSEPVGNANVVATTEEPEVRPVVSPKEVSRVILPGATDEAPATQGADGNAAPDAAAAQPETTADGAHLVKTFTIRGDGSMENNPSLPSTANAAPDASVTDVAATPTNSEDPQTPIVGSGVAEGMSMRPGPNFGIMDSSGVRPPDTTSPAETAASTPVPLPTARPAGLHMASIAETRPQAPEPARPAQLAAAPASTSAAVASGAYTVQLTSQRSQEDAMTAFSNLQRRYTSILGSYQPNLQPVNLGDRGMFYRVRVGSFANPADAQSLCANLKAAGGDCIVQRN
jgi:hypothetical protein